MENHDKSFNTICRVCLNHGKTDKMVSLTDDSGENGLSPYGLSFENISRISVKQNNYMPTKICHKCKRSLEKIAKFTITSEISDRKLAKVISFSLKQDLDEEMVKEVVHQYTLFSENFPDESKVNADQPNTSQHDADMLRYSVKHLKQTDEKNQKIPKIKVEVDVQAINPDSDSGDDSSFKITDKTSGLTEDNTTTDNVDIFLHSIEKLITTKVDDFNETEVRPKKDLKEKITEQDLTCNICHKTLASPATYKHHMERHGICRYICDQCGKGFPVLTELTQHQIYRHGIGSTLECDQCSFKAARREELVEHIRLHTGERPFTCEKCGLTFRRKAIYRTHLKFHGERTVPCHYCPRKFYRRSEMLAHSNNIHERVYVFLCKICNITYAMAKTVRRHMLVKHGIPRHKQGKVIRINKTSDTPDSNFFIENNKVVEFTNV